jgi:hypothetical protein
VGSAHMRPMTVTALSPPARVAVRTAAAVKELTTEQIHAILDASTRRSSRVLPVLWDTALPARPSKSDPRVLPDVLIVRLRDGPASQTPDPGESVFHTFGAGVAGRGPKAIEILSVKEEHWLRRLVGF